MHLIRLVVAIAAMGTLMAQAQSSSSYVSRTIAGVFPAGDGGPATAALLESPQAVAADSSGNLYVADGGNSVIRKITRAGAISSIAGYSGYAFDLKLDTAGNIYIAGGTYAYKMSQTGTLTTVAGNGSYSFSGDGGAATSAGFNGIYALAIDSANNLFICDSNNHRIRKVTPNGIVQTIAGGNGKGFTGDNGPASNALLDYPRHAAVDAAGNLYFNDYNNNRVRKITPDGTITTFAGSGVCCSSPDGGLATAAFLSTGPVTADPSGAVYVFDFFAYRVRRVSPSGILQSYAGDGNLGFAGDGQPAISARFANVAGMGTDTQNNLYIVDADNERIRMVSGGTVSTVVGRGHFDGDGGVATAALLHRPRGVVTAADGTSYFVDAANHRVRKIGTDGKISTVAGTGVAGYTGNGGPATAATMKYPDSIAIDSAGNLFVVDQSQLVVRKITPAGIISTAAGNGTLAFSNDVRGALGSGFAYIAGIAVDSSGNLYLSEQSHHEIKKIVPTGGMTTYAGTGGVGFGGDGGAALQAVLAYPGALAVSDGNLYIADTLNYAIRKVDANGAIASVAGTGKCCDSGDGGLAIQARVSANGMVADANGGLWFTDDLGVRYIGRDGTIRRVAGGNALGLAGDDLSAGGDTMYNTPSGIALNAAGEVILADTFNSRIRKLQPNDPAKMDILRGNNQQGLTGTALNAMVVKMTGKAGIGAGGVGVTFTVTSGSADLSAKTAQTDASGQAGVAATVKKAGTITVTATFGNLTATFTASATDPAVIPPDSIPVISQGGIGQNGFSVPPVQMVSPGAITTIYGSNFMATGMAAAVNTVVNGQLSSKVGGVCVTFGGVPVPIFAVAATQVTVEVPVLVPGPVAVQVLRNCGDATEQKSNVLSATAQAASPEFLYLQVNGDGRNPVAAFGALGEYVGPPGLISGVTFRAAKPGDVLVVYALGFGATNPAQATGVPAPGAAIVAQAVNITIGGVPLAASDILYAGASPSYIGLYQLNVRVPDGVASGNQSMVVQVGGSRSPAGGYLAVQ